MIKHKIFHILRRLGLAKTLDNLRFYNSWIKNHKLRKKFKSKYPNVVLPPPYFLYETFNLNYFSYYEKGIDTAKWLINHLEKHTSLNNIRILDWGCGPGRIISRLPEFLIDNCEFYGSDYNTKYIEWCKKNLKNIHFSTNKLEPSLVHEANFFNVIYGISIFTHLSEDMHYQWFRELLRTLKKDGILLLTLHGNAFLKKLSKNEQENFNKGKLVVKGNTTEGHRTYSAFQPKSFVKNLIGDNELLEHIPGKIIDNVPQQDVWIIRKKL